MDGRGNYVERGKKHLNRDANYATQGEIQQVLARRDAGFAGA